VLTKGTHGTTFGGNPVVCAGAVQVLRIMEQPETMKAITEKSSYLRKRLSALDEVAEVTGKGLMVGIALKTKKAPDVLQACLERGLLVLTAKDRVRLLPPLTISMEELKTGTEILCKVLED
jgi:acetylornithine/N-succinyldiaminopimelate aminotransferase